MGQKEKKIQKKIPSRTKGTLWRFNLQLITIIIFFFEVEVVVVEDIVSRFLICKVLRIKCQNLGGKCTKIGLISFQKFPFHRHHHHNHFSFHHRAFHHHYHHYHDDDDDDDFPWLLWGNNEATAALEANPKNRFHPASQPGSQPGNPPPPPLELI